MEEVSFETLYNKADDYKKLFKTFNESLTSEEVESLAFYKGNGFININRILNGQSFIFRKSKIPLTLFKKSFLQKQYEKVKKDIQNIDDVFDKVPKRIKNKIPEVLYRGTSIPDLVVGNSYISKGFMSTTLAPFIASQFIGCEGCCILKMIVKTGLPYVYLPWPFEKEDEILGHSELEILLPRNIRFKVLSMEKVSLTASHIRCSLSEIKNSKRKKINLYTCEIEELMDVDKTIEDVKIEIVN